MRARPVAAPPTRADFHSAISERADRWFSACLAITRNRDLAEDALQDALLSAWNKREQFQHGAELDTWIHRIAINSALQVLRRQRPGRLFALDFEIVDEAASAEDERYAEELGAGLEAALGRLTELERICFVLKHLEQWRLKEIAEELGSNVGMVKQAVFRAVRKLRGALPKMARASS